MSGCAATRSSSTLERTNIDSINAELLTPTPAYKLILSEEDILDKRYVTLGDISVTVSKTTIFNKDPTRGQVEEKLRVEAAKLGADAVVLIRFGSVGITAVSWGVLKGNGRAVKFIE
jgi:hypothetical protein